MAKKVIIGILIFIVVLFFYGYFKGYSQYHEGVSLLEISITMSTLNPISEKGYVLYMRSNEVVMDAVDDFLESYNEIKSWGEN